MSLSDFWSMTPTEWRMCFYHKLAQMPGDQKRLSSADVDEINAATEADGARSKVRT